MSDETVENVMSSTRYAKLSPENLELMGKQAANLFLQEEVALNEGIAKIAGVYDDINHEQIKRICEFANTAVYLAMHDKNKTAGVSTSYPQFNLADPFRIIQDMSDGARPTVITDTDVDYGRLPETPKLASQELDTLLENMFLKTASKDDEEKYREENLGYTVGSAIEEVHNTKTSLDALRDHLSHTAELLDLTEKQAQVDYYDLVKRHLLDNGNFFDVLAAARSTGLQEEKIASVLNPVVQKLIKEKVASPSVLKESVNNLTKVAHRVVNEKHPLVKSFSTIVACQAELEKVAMGLEEACQYSEDINDLLKEKIYENKPK